MGIRAILEEIAALPTTRAGERYMGNWSRAPRLRGGGEGAAAALLARSAGEAQRLSPTARALGECGEAARTMVAQAVTGRLPEVVAAVPEVAIVFAGAALQVAGDGYMRLVSLEQSLTSSVVGRLSFGSFPAMVAGSMSIGLPHAHGHPPNVVPPNPIPIPLPSAGPVIPIPYLSTAATVTIGGMPAARCGDMGLALWCGGYFPMFEIATGSSSVWIEGMRAARMLDVTRHCMFSSPRPQDPPLGPMLGMAINCAPSIAVGGIPMPSLANLAIASALRIAFSLGGRALLRLTARRGVERMIRRGSIEITGDAQYVARVRANLERIARTRVGRDTLRRIERSQHRLTIRPMDAVEEIAVAGQPRLRIHGGHNAFAQADSAGGFLDRAGQAGDGCNVTVAHSPERWADQGGPAARLEVEQAGTFVDAGSTAAPAGTRSDEVLFHELNHAANYMEGTSAQYLRGNGSLLPYTPGPDEWASRWTNAEEYSTVWAENAYRRETRGPLAAQRTGYGTMP